MSGKMHGLQALSTAVMIALVAALRRITNRDGG